MSILKSFSSNVKRIAGDWFSSKPKYSSVLEAWQAEDYEAVFIWMKFQAQNGNATSAYTLSKFLTDGTGTKIDLREARTWLERAAELGNPEAQVDLGDTILKEDPENFDQAIIWIKSAADQGHAEACFYAANYFLYKAKIPDYASALRYYETAANSGNAEACHHLGMMYDAGTGVARNHTIAAQWYTKSSDAGDPLAQARLGQMYEYGEGVPMSAEKAHDLYLASANQGYPTALFSLGLLYARGNGVPKDPMLAHKWLNLAAGAGVKLAADTRDKIAEELDDVHEAMAQRLATEWLESHSIMQKPQ